MARIFSLAVSLFFFFGIALADVPAARRGELKNFLIQDCGSCHGLTFKGGLGPSLLPESLTGKPKSLLVSTILDGRPGTAMPPWKNLLTRDEANWIAEQLLRGIE